MLQLVSKSNPVSLVWIFKMLQFPPLHWQTFPSTLSHNHNINLTKKCEITSMVLLPSQLDVMQLCKWAHFTISRLRLRIAVFPIFLECLQELILEKVREDVMVRRKISQSSALRQKRRDQNLENQRSDSMEAETRMGLNNNGPYSENKGLIHTNGPTGQLENVFDQVQDLKITNTTHEEEEGDEEVEIFSPDSLSEVSKFESESCNWRESVFIEFLTLMYY